MAFVTDTMTPQQIKALNEAFELMKSRNWITEQMVEQMQHHCNCTREQALEKLLPKSILSETLQPALT